MTIAVMQPYFMPYLGYFQLVSSVDKFIFFDDVNFIKKGWINRNQILQNEKILKFTIPLIKASQNKLINEIEISNFQIWRTDFLKTLEYSYKKAPNFSFVFELINSILLKKNDCTMCELAIESVMAISDFIGIKTTFLKSSELSYKDDKIQKGQEKIISICKILDATNYINPQNGECLYDKTIFKENGIDIKFLKMNGIEYSQNNNTFVPLLSIIDVLMFNNGEETQNLIREYQIT